MRKNVIVMALKWTLMNNSIGFVFKIPDSLSRVPSVCASNIRLNLTVELCGHAALVRVSFTLYGIIQRC